MARSYSSSFDHSEVGVSVAETLPVSMWCWAYPLDATNSHILMWIGDKDDAFRFIAMWLSGNLAGDPLRTYQHDYGGSGPAVADSTVAYNANEWNGCGSVFVSNSSRLNYLNGTKSTNSDTGPNSPHSHDRTAIGWLGDSTPSYSNGIYIAEAAVWDVELSEAEFASLQEGYSPRFIRPGSLKGYWPLLRSDDCVVNHSLDMSTTGSSYVDHPPTISYPTVRPMTGQGVATQTIKKIASDSTGGSANSATSASMDSTGATLAVVVVSWYNTTVDVTAISDSKSNTWSKLTTKNSATSRVAIFYSELSSVGSGHTVTFSDTASYASIHTTFWSGTGASPLDQSVGAVGQSAGTITPTEDKELIVTGQVAGGGEPTSITFFEFESGVAYSAGNYMGGAVAYQIQTGLAARNAVFSGATGTFATVAASFKTGSAATAAVSGTATATITESDIVTGGKTVIITLTGATFKAAGTGPIGSTANTQALIDNIVAATSPTNGWNNVVGPGAETADIVRNSSTQCTWTLDAEASYDVTSTETITVTVPTDVLDSGGPIVAAPTFTVDAVSAGGRKPTLTLLGVG